MTTGDKAREMIIQNYEQLTGTNLYGFFPDRSIWNGPEFTQAIKKTKQQARASQNAEMLYFLNLKWPKI